MREAYSANSSRALIGNLSGAASGLAHHIELLKPRVMSLVVFTGAVGLAVAPGPVDLATSLVALSAMAAGAGACGALNMWYDADIDALMSRTASRPIPDGRATPTSALLIGALMAAASVASLGVFVNWLAAALLALTIVIYVPVYTFCLKRRTPMSTVIGGAAGALPPVVGWAAATGSVDLGALTLFLIIFLWTPPHFWSLALVRCADYERALVPMLPVVAGEAATCRRIALYSLLLVPASLAPVVLGFAGPVYGAMALALGAGFLGCVFVLARQREPRTRRTAALRLFGFSIFYMCALFAALLAGAT